MTIEWRLGPATTTTARIFARSDTNGVLDAIVDSTTYTGTTLDTTVDDGCGFVEVTGLTAGSSHTFSLRVGAVEEATGTLLTTKTGDTTIIFGSCEDGAHAMLQGDLDIGGDYFVLLGDAPYTNGARTRYGITAASGDADITAAGTFLPHNQITIANPGFQSILQRMPSVWGPDDHEQPSDNWDHTEDFLTAELIATMGGSPVAQTDIDDLYDVSNQSWRSYHVDHDFFSGPIDRPAAADAGSPDSFYPNQYSTFTLGFADCFLIECVSAKSPINDTDNASKLLIGANQEAALIAWAKASTNNHRIIFSPKFTGNRPGGQNLDGWISYQTQFNRILQEFEDENIDTVWMCGDDHVPAIATQINGFDHLGINATPLGSDVKVEQVTNQTNRIISESVTDYDNLSPYSIGRIKVTPESVITEIIDISGDIIGTFPVSQGSSILAYNNPTVTANEVTNVAFLGLHWTDTGGDATSTRTDAATTSYSTNNAYVVTQGLVPEGAIFSSVFVRHDEFGATILFRLYVADGSGEPTGTPVFSSQSIVTASGGGIVNNSFTLDTKYTNPTERVLVAVMKMVSGSMRTVDASIAGGGTLPDTVNSRNIGDLGAGDAWLTSNNPTRQFVFGFEFALAGGSRGLKDIKRASQPNLTPNYKTRSQQGGGGGGAKHRSPHTKIR